MGTELVPFWNLRLHPSFSECSRKISVTFHSVSLFPTGKYYYEVSCHDQGLCRVGWSTGQASLDLGELLKRPSHYFLFEGCAPVSIC